VIRFRPLDELLAEASFAFLDGRILGGFGAPYGLYDTTAIVAYCVGTGNGGYGEYCIAGDAYHQPLGRTGWTAGGYGDTDVGDGWGRSLWLRSGPGPDREVLE